MITAPTLRRLQEAGLVSILEIRGNTATEPRCLSGSVPISPHVSSEVIHRTVPNIEAMVVLYSVHPLPVCELFRELMTSFGYLNVIVWPGGMDEWASLGFPVTAR